MQIKLWIIIFSSKTLDKTLSKILKKNVYYTILTSVFKKKKLWFWF